jgi:signal transduction histidine kinase/DNA-binding NarL/FixJ family response regulator
MQSPQETNFNDWLQILWNLGPSMGLVHDTGGQILFWHPGWEAFLPNCQTEIKNINELLDLDENQRMTNSYWDQLQEHGRYAGDLCIRNAYPESVFLGLTATKLKTQGANMVFLVAENQTSLRKVEQELDLATRLSDLNLSRLHKTLTDLQKAKQSAEDSMRIKDSFLANISHEIRTPMNGILGFSEVLLKWMPQVTERKYLEAIKTSAENLMTIINDILDVSKLESGKFTLDEYPFDVIQILQQIRHLFELRIQEKGLKFKLIFPEKMPRFLHGDPGRLNQILVNLVGNAIKFTQKGSIGLSVEVLASSSNAAQLMFEVSDTGIGISKEEIPLVFETFRQLETGYQRNYQGSGLGLSICKQLVDIQGGSIWAESEKGEGTRFFVELSFPLASPAEVKKQKAETKGRSHEPRLQHILVAEDNPINTLLAGKILEDAGFVVTHAENGKEAVEALKAKQPDLVLMDIQMPVMDGYEATRIIRSLPGSLGSTPILATTAHSTEAETQKCLEAGMQGFVSKPFVAEHLIQRILELTSNSELPILEKPNSQNTKPEPDPNDTEFNLASLKRLGGNDPDFEQGMAHLFIQKLPEFILNMRDGLEQENWTQYRKAAHKVLPNISMMGLEKEASYLVEIDENKTGEQLDWEKEKAFFKAFSERAFALRDYLIRIYS